MTPGSHIRAVPDRPDPEVYGFVEFFDGVTVHKLTIDVAYGKDWPDSAIVLDPNGAVLRHPYDGPRESTEDERAAVGWTW